MIGEVPLKHQWLGERSVLFFYVLTTIFLPETSKKAMKPIIPFFDDMIPNKKVVSEVKNGGHFAHIKIR